MNATRQQGILGKRSHRPLMVRAKLALINVGAVWNRSLKRIEILLGLFAPDRLQPGDRFVFVRGALSQGKTIRDDDK